MSDADKKQSWSVDYTSTPGILSCVLRGTISPSEMKAFVEAHNRGVDAMAGADYRVWVDIRELLPLSPETTDIMEQCKVYSSHHPNFQGSAVLVKGATVAMQHRRTSVTGGVIESEFISDDEAACRRHLASVSRSSPPQPNGRRTQKTR